MREWIEVTGKTVDDAVTEALIQLGTVRENVEIEVVEKESDEFFGNYLHMGGKIAVLTVVKGANEEVAKDVAMQAAAMKPEYLCESEVPEEVVEREKAVLTALPTPKQKPLFLPI